MTSTSLDPRDDQSLWSAVVSGDADAYGALFQRHQQSVYTYCFRRTSSWSTAEDLVAVVFLEAWRTRRAMQLQSGSLLPWLLGIATHCTSHHHRSLSRHSTALARLAARWEEQPDLADDVVQRLADEGRMQQVSKAFARLPGRERDVLELAMFAELDYARISIALNIPIGTVRSRLSRAKARLRLDVGVSPAPKGH